MSQEVVLHKPKQFRWSFRSCPIVDILDVCIRLGLPTAAALALAGPSRTTTLALLRSAGASVARGSAHGAVVQRGGWWSALAPLNRRRAIVLQTTRPLATMGHCGGNELRLSRPELCLRPRPTGTPCTLHYTECPRSLRTEGH